jgi:phosphopentomutase
VKRAFLVVLDGLGVGAADDAAAYGDAGSDTLGNVARAVGGLRLPVLEGLGLGRIAPLQGVRALERPRAACGRLHPASAGKDSTTGHWELCGLVVPRPFPTYPGGFPPDVMEAFARRTGRGWLGNRAASGTRILDDLGAEHLACGKWIVYTSADSVFQVAAHEAVVPLEELYAACEAARAMLTGEHGVSRVIARPFLGEPGAFVRDSARRRDYSVEPTGPTLLDRLAEAGVPRTGIGKVDDLFARRGITSTHTPTNGDAYRLLRDALTDVDFGLVFANVIEFDQSWGHRNDVAGFHAGLRELDAALGALLPLVRRDDVLVLTADHGNDPTTASTDHSRECVPAIVFGPRVRPADLGRRESFADVGQTLAAFFGVPALPAGASFLEVLA